MHSELEPTEPEWSVMTELRCTRCVMPSTYPGVSVDSEGVCNHCRHYDKHWQPWVQSAERRLQSEQQLLRIFDRARSQRRPFDALLGISGGKDSSYCLYLCREVYNLNVLTVTRDNGLMSEDGKERVNRLVRVFDVPHLYYQDPLVRELAGVFMRKTGNFCAPCELLSFNIHAVVAREFDIPVVVVGSSSRTDGAPPKDMNPWDPWYFGNVLRGEQYNERLRCSFFSRNYIVREGISRVLGRRRIITLPDYVEWDEERISQLFYDRYGIDFGAEHSDCFATDVADYIYRRKCGGDGPKTVKYSLLVRGGKLTRDEAIRRLGEADTGSPPPGLERFLYATGMTEEEFGEAIERTPDAYVKGLPHLFNLLRKRIRRQAS